MFRWYVVNTYSGHENKVKHNLEHRVVSLGQQLGKTRNPEPLRSDKQELQVALDVVDACLPGAFAITPRVNAFGRQAKIFQLAHLVIHQGYERSDHQRGSTACQPRQLRARESPSGSDSR